jgi:PAP2 superfamily
MTSNTLISGKVDVEAASLRRCASRRHLLIAPMLLALLPHVDAAVSAPRSVLIQWNGAALQGVRDAKIGVPMAARALAVVHTCMFDAWAAYDEHAVGTQLRGALRRPANERTQANKERAISYAAYRALADVLPVDTESVYKPLMQQLGYDPNDNSTDIETPTGIGNVACGAVLEFRHHDKSNQLGDLAQGPFSDWSNYSPVNTPAIIPAPAPAANPDHWQPLVYTDATGSLVSQKFAGAQWCFVAPFAMTKGEEFRPAVEPGPAKYGSPEYQQQAEELIAISANLTDRQKMISEYWSDGPYSEQPPGHWAQFAQFVSARDHHSLDDDVKMFFALTNAMLDASIAAWDAKRAYDSVRPVTAISTLFRGTKIRAWGGPGKGTVEMDGSEWLPYQLATFPTPPFPEYVSGHSTYSASAARILTLWTGSDHFGHSVTLAAGSSKIEPSLTPALPITLKWETFTAAADEAGMSRRYGGIHFERADLAGRKLGRLVADRAWAKAQTYFDGSNTSSLRDLTAAK